MLESKLKCKKLTPNTIQSILFLLVYQYTTPILFNLHTFLCKLCKLNRNGDRMSKPNKLNTRRIVLESNIWWVLVPITRSSQVEQEKTSITLERLKLVYGKKEHSHQSISYVIFLDQWLFLRCLNSYIIVISFDFNIKVLLYARDVSSFY